MRRIPSIFNHIETERIKKHTRVPVANHANHENLILFRICHSYFEHLALFYCSINRHLSELNDHDTENK